MNRRSSSGNRFWVSLLEELLSYLVWGLLFLPPLIIGYYFDWGVWLMPSLLVISVLTYFSIGQFAPPISRRASDAGSDSDGVLSHDERNPEEQPRWARRVRISSLIVAAYSVLFPITSLVLFNEELHLIWLPAFGLSALICAAFLAVRALQRRR